MTSALPAIDEKALIAELRRDEGVRAKPYDDATGKPPEAIGKITVGVGRNLTDVGLSDDEIDYLLSNDIARVVSDLDAHLPWWRNLIEARRRVLVNMAFNLGITGLLGFKNTLAFVKAGQWDKAASGMLASRWAKQVGARAVRLAEMMRTGKV